MMYSKSQTRARPSQGGRFAKPVIGTPLVILETSEARGGSANRGKLRTIGNLLIPDPPASPVPVAPLTTRPTSLKDIDGWRNYLNDSKSVAIISSGSELKFDEILSRGEAFDRGFAAERTYPRDEAVVVRHSDKGCWALGMDSGPFVAKLVIGQMYKIEEIPVGHFFHHFFHHDSGLRNCQLQKISNDDSRLNGTSPKSCAASVWRNGGGVAYSTPGELNCIYDGP